MHRVSLLMLGAAALLCLPGLAQDQVEVLDDAMLPLNWTGTGTPPNPRQMTYAQAKDLINQTLQAQDSPSPAYVDDPNFYCLIHAVVWKQPASDTAKPEIDFKRWYVFRGGKKWGQVDLEGARLYGGHRVAVLAVHWTQSVDTSAEAIAAAVSASDPKLDASGITAAVAKHADQIKNGQLGSMRDSSGAALVMRNGILFVHGFPPETPVAYRLEVTGKLPAPWAHLAGIISAVAHADGLKLRNRLQMVWAGRLFNIQYVPSDMVARLLFDVSLTELDNKMFDNEGLYRFDFSAGLPLRSAKQLQYDSTAGSVTPTTVDKYTVFGLFDYFFKPVDVSTDYKISQPYLVTGLGLTGRPWERTIIGVGLGYHKFSGFIGANWNRVQNGVTTTGGVSTPHREWDAHPKLVFGVNLTAKQLTDLLKPKK